MGEEGTERWTLPSKGYKRGSSVKGIFRVHTLCMNMVMFANDNNYS